MYVDILFVSLKSPATYQAWCFLPQAGGGECPRETAGPASHIPCVSFMGAKKQLAVTLPQAARVAPGDLAGTRAAAYNRLGEPGRTSVVRFSSLEAGSDAR